MLRALCEVWQAQHGGHYRPTQADKSQLGRYMNPGKGQPRATPEELAELPRLYALYVADPDGFVAKQGWSIAWFLTGSGGPNKYRAKGRPNGFTERELRGHAAADDWAKGGHR